VHDKRLAQTLCQAEQQGHLEEHIELSPAGAPQHKVQVWTLVPQDLPLAMVTYPMRSSHLPISGVDEEME